MINDVFAKSFSNISQWVAEQGWIEIGQDENSESLVRAVDPGGLVWESTEQHQSIDDALNALEHFLTQWFEENG